jgi:hypothetical protein
MALYAKDAEETDKPWERWEEHIPHGSKRWLPCTDTPSWSDSLEYRQKLKAIKLYHWLVYDTDTKMYGETFFYFESAEEVKEYYQLPKYKVIKRLDNTEIELG